MADDHAQAHLDLLKEIEDRSPAVNRILSEASKGFKSDPTRAFLRAFDLYVERDKQNRLYGDTMARLHGDTQPRQK